MTPGGIYSSKTNLKLTSNIRKAEALHTKRGTSNIIKRRSFDHSLLSSN
jgi:hypothetical protein